MNTGPYQKPTDFSSELLALALELTSNGVSVIPIDHATKKPLMRVLPKDEANGPTWKPFQSKIADEATVRGWFDAANVEAIAVVGGAVSGGLLILDFDVPEFHERWVATVGELAEGLPVQQTGGGGYQVFLRCEQPGGNTSLAWAKRESEDAGREIAIETRGEGGYAVVAPSLHKSGNRYKMLAGSLTSIPTIPQARADALLAAARKLDEAPFTKQQIEAAQRREAAASEYRKHRESANGQASVIDEFNRRFDVEGILLSHGYERGRNGMFVRPGSKSKNPSVTVRDNRSFHHSTNDPMCDGFWHRPFDIYCRLDHGDDCRTAVKAAAPLLGLNAAHGVNGSETPGRAGENRGSVDAIPPYKPFPTAVLPSALSRYIDAGEKALGCDPAYLALPLLTMMAAAIGNSRRIQLKSSWREPPILWTMVVGDSGTLKTPAFKLALRAVRQGQKLRMEEFRSKEADHRQAMERYDASLKQWRKTSPDKQSECPMEPEPPVCERLWCSDTTVEALADRLNDATRGLLLARDELSGWFSSFNQYKGGQGGDVAHWLEMYNAGHLLVDRKNGEKTTISVPRAAVCIAGGIQPGALRRCLTTQFHDNGLAARFLFAMPPRREKEWTDDQINDVVLNKIDCIHNELLALRPTTDSNGEQVPLNITLTVEAQTAWKEFYIAHAKEQAELNCSELVAAWSKLEAYAARLALVIHCIREVSDGVEDSSRIDLVSMKPGIALVKWFGNEAKRVYASKIESADERRLRELIEFIRKRGGKVTARDLSIKWRRYRNKTDLAHADLKALVEAGLGQWTYPAPSPQGGRPSELFVLNIDEDDVTASEYQAPVYETPAAAGVGGGSGTVDTVDGSDDTLNNPALDVAQ